MSPVIAITGPTASGKSALAELVALEVGSPVISADAMQVYRGMDIGTAKTPVGERRVPLLLVDVVGPAEPYSAALYQRDAREEIDRELSSGIQPILCGGTGLYIQAALDEFSFPRGELASSAREAYEKIARDQGADAVHRLLEQRDPASAAIIHPNNVRRAIRALEMHDQGVSYAEQAAGFSHTHEHYPHKTFALTMGRERLYKRIDERVDMMLGQGLVEEVEGLMEAGAADALTSRQAIGYKQVIDALEGRCTMDEAIGLVKRRTRRYAKRQLSWCRRDKRIEWLDMDALSTSDALARIMGGIGR